VLTKRRGARTLLGPFHNIQPTSKPFTNTDAMPPHASGTGSGSATTSLTIAPSASITMQVHPPSTPAPHAHSQNPATLLEFVFGLATAVRPAATTPRVVGWRTVPMHNRHSTSAEVFCHGPRRGCVLQL